jgi:hypothetical protein
MIAQYHFNPQQAGMLNGLMQEKYRELFMGLIGSYEDITLSPQEIAAIMQNLPVDLDEQRRNIVLAAYSLVGKVSYFWGGKSSVIGFGQPVGNTHQSYCRRQSYNRYDKTFRSGLLRLCSLGVYQLRLGRTK